MVYFILLGKITIGLKFLVVKFYLRHGRRFFSQNLELKNALQPRTKLSISLQNGLCIRHQKCWLNGYEPNVIVYGFYPKVNVEVFDLQEGKAIKQIESQSTNETFSLNLNKSGNYLIKASSHEEFAETFFCL